MQIRNVFDPFVNGFGTLLCVTVNLEDLKKIIVNQFSLFSFPLSFANKLCIMRIKLNVSIRKFSAQKNTLSLHFRLIFQIITFALFLLHKLILINE